MTHIETPIKINYLKGIKQNNPTLIRHIYDTFFPRILNYIQKNDGNTEDAEDIFADTMEIIFRKVSKDELILHCAFYTYFFEVCKRLWSKVNRRRKNYNALINRTGLSDICESISHTFEERERYNLYKEKFKELSANSQKVLLLAIIEKKSMAEIASVMGYKSTGYARKRKHQCLQKLLTLIRKDRRYMELRN